MISIVICTHNPRASYLARTIDALRQQTLPTEQWELLVVDNASTPPVEPGLNLGWHPSARLIREESLGLTHAQLRGIKETNGDLLLFVDDDNVLDPNYLETLTQLAAARPYLAAFGGNISGEFECSPPPWYNGLLGWLAIIKTDRDIWGNSYKLEQLPVGAGLCVRREVANRYAGDVANDPGRLTLDRRGEILSSGGDTDLVLTAIDLGYGVGVFKALHLTHLIPSTRLTQSYLLRLAEAMAFSQVIRARMGRGPSKPAANWRRKALDFLKRPFLSRFNRQLLNARIQGDSRARQIPLTAPSSKS
ncbi:glycosyltransferase [Verrucomicrobium sp. BvORR034]|uniref:glycosyltransferase n=1 Tax=Verrucomicrobium sp. BvORR034 TaxID=1396418 RepID=UPI000679332D|nr:glycosyltransferase [Verrucomicrobium sp. BvORR034]